jgi:hypothetical protein
LGNDTKEFLIVYRKKSEFNKNGTVEKLVVDSVKNGTSPRVLKVSGAMEDIIIVDLLRGRSIAA